MTDNSVDDTFSSSVTDENQPLISAHGIGWLLREGEQSGDESSAQRIEKRQNRRRNRRIKSKENSVSD